MDTPLKAIRLRRELTLAQVAAAVKSDTGNLSRVERGEQTASVELAEKLAKFFGHEVTEMQILYPSRYMDDKDKDGAA
jgi:transcriptional regulator with XRE-family HTH domain